MQLRLIHNIFTEGTTLLKMLAKADNAREVSNKSNSIDDCDQIFVKALEGFEI